MTSIKGYYQSHEKELSVPIILLHYVLVNRLIRFIALVNAFIYLVCCGVPGWAHDNLKESKLFLWILIVPCFLVILFTVLT